MFMREDIMPATCLSLRVTFEKGPSCDSESQFVTNYVIGYFTKRLLPSAVADVPKTA